LRRPPPGRAARSSNRLSGTEIAIIFGAIVVAVIWGTYHFLPALWERGTSYLWERVKDGFRGMIEADRTRTPRRR
jgi:hypothetical protein